jgi:hypothetical protein
MASIAAKKAARRRHVVRVEPVGVERIPLPGDVHGDEQTREPQEPRHRVIEHELMAELGDRDDEDEVEEELEPRRPALVPLLCGSEARRDQPARPVNRDHELDVGSCSPPEVDAHPAQRRHARNGAQTLRGRTFGTPERSSVSSSCGVEQSGSSLGS